MAPYDDNYQWQLEYEWELERQEYERQRRLQEDEQQRQLEYEEWQQQREWEREQARQRQLEAPASARPPSRTKETVKHDCGRNGRWARQTREEEHRQVHEDDEKHGADRRSAAPGHRHQRSFIFPVFVGALALLLSVIAFRAFGSYPVASITADPLTGHGHNGHRLSQTVMR